MLGTGVTLARMGACVQTQANNEELVLHWESLATEAKMQSISRLGESERRTLTREAASQPFMLELRRKLRYCLAVIRRVVKLP